jgi:hypothetical protein
MNINEENNPTIEQRIERKLQEAEIPGREVEFDPDEARRDQWRRQNESYSSARRTASRAADVGGRSPRIRAGWQRGLR